MSIKEYKKILGNLTIIQKEIDKEQDELWKFSTFIQSLKNVLNYVETGNPYPEEI